jgi:hypothetical protein
MTREEYIHAWHYFNYRVMNAKKDNHKEPFTEEQHQIWQRVREGDLPWQTFSRVRGYTQEEIADCERWRELTPTRVLEDVDFTWDLVDGNQTITNPEILWEYVRHKRTRYSQLSMLRRIKQVVGMKD